MNHYIPERFAHRVIRHAVAAACLERHPLVLMVQGPPGDGKSFQVRRTLESWGIEVFTRSSATLSGGLESDSVEKFKEVLDKVEDFYSKHADSLAAIVLEDFDLSPAGRQEKSEYTVNSQLLTGFLMNMADGVEVHRLASARRTPVFITGNDFSVLHRPLVRPGRMDVFTWNPTPEERARIIGSIIGRHVPPSEEGRLEEVIKMNADLSISAFAAAVDLCRAEHLLRHVLTTGELDVDTLRHEFGDHARTPLSMAEINEALEDARELPRKFI